MTSSFSIPSPWAAAEPPGFDHPNLAELLDGATALQGLDDLPFGLIVMDRSGVVIAYNAYESRRAGLDRHRVLGRNFFQEVGPCTNNYLIAERYDTEEELDEELDYVFTFRMAPTPVRLRLLLRRGSTRQYLAVRPR
jgi:photoactive yellow protein